MKETEQKSIDVNSDPKLTIEALIFVSNAPVTRNQLKEILTKASDDDIEKYIDELNGEYEKTGRSFRIEEIAGGWQIRTKPEFAAPIKSLLNIQRRERLSGPALETLAIIAYKQPVTRTEIEGIRGVNVDWMISTLIDKDLVKVAGKKDIVGHPFMYGTTTRFLEHFGLASLKDLPNVEELRQKNISIKPKAEEPLKDETATQEQSAYSIANESEEMPISEEASESASSGKNMEESKGDV